MPLYEYRCESCNTQFEIRQGFEDDPLDVCPHCQAEGDVNRLIGAAGIIFKGSGFYVTDSRKATNSAAPGKNGASEGEGTKSEGKTETKSEKKTNKSDTTSKKASGSDAKTA